MNTKHTPGPWLTDEMMPGDQYRYVFAAKGPIVCRVSAFAAGEANARLIAAAPDLFAQLGDLVEIVEAAIAASDWKVDGCCDPDLTLQRARFALAKAEGRA